MKGHLSSRIVYVYLESFGQRCRRFSKSLGGASHVSPPMFSLFSVILLCQPLIFVRLSGDVILIINLVLTFAIFFSSVVVLVFVLINDFQNSYVSLRSLSLLSNSVFIPFRYGVSIIHHYRLIWLQWCQSSAFLDIWGVIYHYIELGHTVGGSYYLYIFLKYAF